MKKIIKKKVCVLKNKGLSKNVKPAAKSAPQKLAPKFVPKPVIKSKPLVKIADKIRGKVLNIKAIEAAKIPAAPAKQKQKQKAGGDLPEFEIKKTKIRIVGIGGGGGNIVSEIADRVKKSSFVVANTDAAALRHVSKNVSVFQFGENFTRGLGTGMDPRVAEEAASQDKEKIKKIMEGQDLVIIVAALGGGAGSGAAPIFAQISKSLGNLTYGIFTLPFEFEGAKKTEIAKMSLEKAKPYLNALTILPNERVFEVVPKATPFSKTLSHINTALSDSLEGLIETIYNTGLINIDFADLRAILVGSGKMAFLNTVSLKKGEETGIEVIGKVFSSPLYPYGIDKARGLLLNVVAQKDLKLLEVNKILTGAANRIHKEARIIFGVGHEGARENFIKVTVLATGCVYAEMNGGDDNGRETPPKSNAKTKPAAPLPPPRKPASVLPAPKKKIKPAPDKKTKTAAKEKQDNNARRLAKSKKVAVKIKNLAVEKNAAAGKSQVAPTLDDYQNQKSIEAQFEAPARKNALQVKKEIEMEEQAMLEQEKAWEVPAFLRKQKNK